MDSRTNALVVSLYILGAILIGGIGIYAYGRAASNPAAGRIIDDEDLGAASSIGKGKSARSGSSLAMIDPSAQDVHASLALTRDVLEKRTQALNQKNAECQALKKELDESFLMVLRLMGEGSHGQQVSAEQVRQSKARLDAELASLREAVTKSELLAIEQEQRIAELENSLMQAEVELDEQQQQARRDLDAAMIDKDMADVLAAEVIDQAGESAVPALTTLLTNERPVVRRWALKMLGAIGSPAQDASSAIHDLFADPDAAVREEAQIAFNAIMHPNE